MADSGPRGLPPVTSCAQSARNSARDELPPPPPPPQLLPALKAPSSRGCCLLLPVGSASSHGCCLLRRSTGGSDLLWNLAAATRARISASRACLASSTVSVHATNSERATPLHLAVRCAYFEGISLLLAFGANPDAADARGRRPLHFAALLPAFAGGMDLEVHSAVLAAGVPESGCTVHFIEEAVDGGQIVVQKRCPVLPLDTPESLKARVQPLEGVAFLEAIGIVAAQVRAAACSDPPALS